MKKTCQCASLIVMLFLLFFTGCKEKLMGLNANDSFLPMQIGNLWFMNSANYTEIKDTVSINKKLFYKFYSLVGGDAISISYLRIDEQNRLIEGYPTSPLKTYLKADFKANIGDKFFTTGQKDYNDYEVTVVRKTDTEMIFDFDMVYHPNLKGHPFSVKYIKGKGFSGDWKKLRINNIDVQH